MTFLWSSHCTRIFSRYTIQNFESKNFLKLKTLAKIRGRHKLIPGSQISRFWPSGESASHHLLISNAQLRRENDFCIENCCRNGFSEKKTGIFRFFLKMSKFSLKSRSLKVLGFRKSFFGRSSAYEINKWCEAFSPDGQMAKISGCHQYVSKNL